MDLFTAMHERRSCRSFLDEPIDKAILEQVLEAGLWAPSPLNAQPWEFIVVTSAEMKTRFLAEANRCRQWAVETSGWKWLASYSADFIAQAPVVVAVVGDPKKSGVDMFQEDGPVGYQHACAAATQNILLAAHALGLGSVWFTFFDKSEMRAILEVPPEKTPLALICLGKPAQAIKPVPRKGLEKKVKYI
jgi:5,6-dimethylbenzimidazole synthase